MNITMFLITCFRRQKSRRRRPDQDPISRSSKTFKTKAKTFLPCSSGKNLKVQKYYIFHNPEQTADMLKPFVYNIYMN